MELQEVELKKVNDVMFKKIGVDVPMLEKSKGFDEDEIPVRGLAVSNRFGCIAFAHSRGFSVAKTADLLKVAETLSDTGEGMKTAKEAAIATVNVPKIRSLAFSHDDLTIAVCAGGNIMFHELADLVQKSGTGPFEVRTVDSQGDTYAKDFSWSPSSYGSYLTLTSRGQLLLGEVGSVPECKVEQDVVAASWSADGTHLAYVADNFQLSISTSDFVKSFQLQLPRHLSDEDNEAELHVDAIRWVRSDSIVVGYVQVNSEGEEDEYPLLVINSRCGNFLQEDDNVVGLLFYQMFPSIDSFVLSSGSGPYMLTDYSKPWKMMVAASRKSIDDHIVVMGWLPEDDKEVLYCLELQNDIWIPRIELQESSEDNAILGLGIDYTTVQIRLLDPRDESGDTMLPPCPVLICLTLEGKLSFFSFARLDNINQFPDLVTPPTSLLDVKRSTPQVSTEDIITAGKPSGPSFANKEKPKNKISSSEISTPETISAVSSEGSEKEQVQKIPINEKDKDQVSLFERFTKPSAMPQGTPHDRPSEIQPSGLTPVSLDLRKTSSSSSFPLDTDSKVPSGSVSRATAARPLDAPKSEPSKAEMAPPPQRLSQLPMAKPQSSIGTSKGVSSGISSYPLGTSPSWNKGLQGAIPPPTSTVVPSFKRITPGDSGASSTTTSSSSLNGPGAVSTGPKLATNHRGVDRFNQGSQSRAASTARVAGISDMEGAFISELEKVRKISDSVDELMSYIEGYQQYGNVLSFTKHSLEELEQGIHVLSEDCKSYKRNLNQAKLRIEDLRDEGMRVDAWRIYVQSLMDQKRDKRHQELWTQQRLHPELEMKRKRVLKADQDLKLQIAELERHLHYLELAQWQQDSARRRTPKHIQSPGQFLSVQNLYNTVNTQMAVAEELSSSLTQQMKSLNIRWSPPTKDSKTAATGILRFVGASSDDTRVSQKSSQSHQLSVPPRHSGRQEVSPLQSPERTIQESTRRRRDSMDTAWVDRGAPITTIKRVGRNRPIQPFPPSNLSTAEIEGKHATAHVSRNENLSQLQNARPTPVRGIRRTSAPPSFSTSSLDGSAPFSGQTGGESSTVPHWQLSSDEPQQIWPGPAFSTTSNIPSAVQVNFNNSREGLFKSPNNVLTAQSQSNIMTGPLPSSVLQASNLKLFAGGSFEGAISNMTANSTRFPPSRTNDGTGGVFNRVVQPFTKSSTGGLPEGPAGAEVPTSKSTFFSRLGTSQGQKSGSLHSMQSVPDINRVEKKEGTQVSEARSTASSTPPLVSPMPSVRQLRSVPTIAPQVITPTASQFTGSSLPSVTPTVPVSFQAAQTKSTGAFLEGSGEVFSQIKAVPKDRSVGHIPNFLKTDSSKLSNARSETSASTDPTELNQKQNFATDLVTNNELRPNQAEHGSEPSPVSGGVVATSSEMSFSKYPSPVSLSSTSSVSPNLLDPTPPAWPQAFSGRASDILVETDSSTRKPISPSAIGNIALSTENLSKLDVPIMGLESIPDLSVASFGTREDTEAPTVSMEAPASSSLQIPAMPHTNSSIFPPGNAGLFPISSVSTQPSSPSPSSPFSTSTSASNQSVGSLFTSSSVPSFSSTSAQSNGSSPFLQPNLFQSAQPAAQQPFVFPATSSSSIVPTATISASPAESTEEDMDEETTTSQNTFSGFGGLGLGSSGTIIQSQKTNPFGGLISVNNQSFQLTPPSGGQLLRPAAFNLPAAQSSPQQSGGSPFSNAFGSPGFSQGNLFSEAGKGFGHVPQQTAGGFGQPAQLGPGQQALGSALGTFGQTRQVGFGASFGGGIGSSLGGGFANAAPGGGFSSTATGGGFASAATGGGFASAATGGGFASAATGGGFASAAMGTRFGGGFAGAAPSGGFAGGGFQAFAGNQGAVPEFGSGVSPAQTNLFTQMRK